MTIDFTFADYFRLTKPTDEQLDEFKDFIGDFSAGKKALRVIMEATHSGMVNLNKKFYIPSRMAEGVGTFRISEKPTKIIKHHNKASDPVGVVRGARFIPTIPDDLQDNPDIMTLMSSSASIKDQLKSTRSLWKAGVFARDDWRGLGYIELIGDIYDKVTVEQINDGRFDAVSTSFTSPGAAHCLICGQNWVKDGFCDHEMFEEYEDDSEDGVKLPALPIPALHKYKEVSLTAFEADTLATISAMDAINEDNNKIVYLPDTWADDITENSDMTVFEFKDYNKEDDMAKEVNLSDIEKKVFDIVKKHRDSMEEEAIVGLAKNIAIWFDKDSKLPDQNEADLDDETAVLYAIEDFEAADQEMDADAVYALFEEELDAIEQNDKKLSTEARKKLGKATFCGPDRSFPVPDCAHVTAARRLIGRYKGPGSRSSILACVSRKATALGCGSNDSNDSQDPDVSANILPCAEDSLKQMKDKELFNLYNSAEMELAGRNLKLTRPCADCAVHTATADALKETAVEAEKKLIEAEDTVRILRDELRRSYSDYTQLMDQYVQQGTDLHVAKAEKFALVGVLTKKYDTIESAVETLMNTDFEKESITIMEGFDLEAATNKLNDGMTREPNDTVDDPTVNNDGDNKQIPQGLTPAAQEAIKNIRELIQDEEHGQANRLYGKMRSLGVFSDELTFESLSADIENPAE